MKKEFKFFKKKFKKKYNSWDKLKQSLVSCKKDA